MWIVDNAKAKKAISACFANSNYNQACFLYSLYYSEVSNELVGSISTVTIAQLFATNCCSGGETRWCHCVGIIRPANRTLSSFTKDERVTTAPLTGHFASYIRKKICFYLSGISHSREIGKQSLI